jgi:hypothetical protein
MRFASRFFSDFQLGAAARAVRASDTGPLIIRLLPYSLPAPALMLPPVEKTPRMVWIGDGEPLEYPEIPRYANALAAAGREVFLHTDGRLLRRRMHEFQPSSRLRLVFCFDSADPSANRDVVEAIRVAKLSGFLVVALTLLHAPSEVDALRELHAQLHSFDLDGRLILPAEGTSELFVALAAAKKQLLDPCWIRVSNTFGFLAMDGVGVFRRRAVRVASISQSAQRQFEEGVQAS